MVALLGVWSLVEGRAPRKGRVRQQVDSRFHWLQIILSQTDVKPGLQGVLRAEGRPQQVQPVSRARRAPEPRKEETLAEKVDKIFSEIEEEYLEEDYNYIDGYDDEYYADGEEYFDEYSGGPNRGDQSLVSPESKPRLC